MKSWINRMFRSLASFLGLKKTAEEIREMNEIMLKATFYTMGYLANCDNRVEECEYDLFEEAQRYLKLNEKRKKATFNFFQQGIRKELELAPLLLSFKKKANKELIHLFFTFQIKMIHADRHIDKREHSLIFEICELLNIPEAEYTRINREEWTNSRFFNQKQQDESTNENWRYQYKSTRSKIHNSMDAESYDSKLSQAYSTLKITPPVNKQTLKKAYRKLIKQYHPDKLIANGLPDEMKKIGEEKTQKIIEAYRLIEPTLR